MHDPITAGDRATSDRTASPASQHSHPRDRKRSGQALVEFSLAIIPFLILLMAVVDLGRGIYMANGTAEAAREIARTTSVHPYDACCDLGSSTQAASTIATQRGLIPGLTINPSVDIVCVDDLDQVIADSTCKPGNYVRVHLTAPFTPITPLVSAFGSHIFDSTSRIQIP
jgi:Flp pilus assembly protein TadG